MRIKLVYPNPNPTVGLSGRKVESAALQLLAAITPAEHDISIVQEHLGDTVGVDDATVDLVGITAMTIQARRAYEIADAYRRAGKMVVLGGIHPSVLPDEALDHADAVVVGEAEPVWTQVLADTAAGKLAGIYRGKDFADLSQLPNYRRDLFPKRSTFSLGSVQAARGCPYDCSFCSATLFAGRKYRFRPVENVIAEIKSMKTRVVFFLDDNIFSNETYCRALFFELKKLNVIWVGQASLHLTASNPDLLALAVESGCISLFVGIESLSEANLRATGALAKNKASTPQDMAKSLSVLQDHGIVVMAGVIFGFDDDDPGVFDRTREFLLDSRVGHGSFSALTPFPGTRLFEELHAQKRITTYDWAKYDGITPVFLPKLMSPEQLRDGTRQIGVNFYSTPNIVRRLWVNRRHPLIYLGTSFAWRHTCRIENGVPFWRRSGPWKKRPESLPAIERMAPAEPIHVSPSNSSEARQGWTAIEPKAHPAKKLRSTTPENEAAEQAVVTEVRQEEALLKAGALQREILNSANFSGIATDAKGVIQIFNVGAERMLGYTAAEVLNKTTPANIFDPKEVIVRAKALSLERHAKLP